MILMRDNTSKTAPVHSCFPATQKLISIIQDLPDHDTSIDEDTARFVVKSLAFENGFENLWTPEERSVDNALTKLQVGPRTAHYGWRLYKRYRASGGWDVDLIGY